MRTFDAATSNTGFYLGVIVPPVVFFGCVQLWAIEVEQGESGLARFLVLAALAQILPLAALLWTLLSAAAYTVGPGKIIVHRVAFDREIALERLIESPELKHGVIILRAERTLRVRVNQPDECMRMIESMLDRGAAQAAM